MTKVATWLLTAGALLFIGVLASQGLPAVLSALAAAGWGLVLVASFTGLEPGTQPPGRVRDHEPVRRLDELGDRDERDVGNLRGVDRVHLVRTLPPREHRRDHEAGHRNEDRR